MEVSIVRQRLNETMERARRSAAARRERSDRAGRAYEIFLEQTAVPLFKQIANVLKANSYSFTVFTPGGSVRLMSDKASDDYIELLLDTSGERPMVIGHTSRARGRRIMESERPIAEEDIESLTDAHVLDFVLKEIEPFVER